MEVLAPYVCAYCGGTRGISRICSAPVHDDEFVAGVGCIVCSQQVRVALIDAKVNKGEGEER